MAVMTREVVTCHPRDTLDGVWALMRDRALKDIPIIDDERYPLGVLSANDALQEILKEAEDEGTLLKDCVMGIG